MAAAERVTGVDPVENETKKKQVMVVFKGGSAKILKSIMAAIIPTGGPFEAGAADYDLLPAADLFVKEYNLLIRKMFPLMLRYIQYSAIFRKGKVFTRLSQEKAERFLTSLEESRFYFNRSVLLLMKLIACMAFYDRDEVARQIGYDHGDLA
ncbi:MAG: hypothetical protein GY754_02765 [bacterium]|nr:hypothetical protein [bacterium]